VLLRPIPQIRLRGPRVRPPSTPIGDPAKLGVQAIKPSGPRVAGPSSFAEAGWHTISDSRTTYGLSLSGGGPITLLKQTVRRRICRSGPRMRRDCGHGLRTNRRGGAAARSRGDRRVRIRPGSRRGLRRAVGCTGGSVVERNRRIERVGGRGLGDIPRFESESLGCNHHSKHGRYARHRQEPEVGDGAIRGLIGSTLPDPLASLRRPAER